jgi:hypothetical protein
VAMEGDFVGVVAGGRASWGLIRVARMSKTVATVA